MKVTAKCHNYTGCVLAYRGDNIELDSGAALVCPECGKAVVLGKAANSWMKTTLLLSLGVVVLGGVLAIFLVPKMRGGSGKDEPPAGQGETPKTETPKTDTPKTVPKITDAPKIEIPVRRAEPAEPPPKAVAPPKIEGDVSRPENKSVKAEVLTRIDLMPNIPQSSKDKLYRSVESARSMAKILTIPFSSGATSPSASDVEILKATLESGEVMKLRDEPTSVFVILGYADSKGDDKKNIAISQARADSVNMVMKTKCNVANITHPVAMGSSKLLDVQNLEKNRIVEVWAVRP